MHPLLQQSKRGRHKNSASIPRSQYEVQCAEMSLVAPYCAIPRDFLSDTPLACALWGFGVSTWPIGCDTPSPLFWAFPHWRACEVEVRYPPPPPHLGYLSDTCAIPYENKANGCDTPLCGTISKGYCAIWGYISHWAAKWDAQHLDPRRPACRLALLVGWPRTCKHNLQLRDRFCPIRRNTGKSHPWTNTSVGGNFRKTFRTIGPYEFPQEKVWTNDWSIWISPEIRMDQWRLKFCKSFLVLTGIGP